MTRYLRVLAPFFGLLVVIVAFSLWEDSFLTLRNLRTVLTQTVIVGLGALGMTFVIVSGGIDLSIGSMIALGSVVTALGCDAGLPPLVAAGLGVLVGAAGGLVNGLLITRLRVVPFIVTLGMLGVARGVAKYLADEQKVDADPAWLREVMAKAPEPSWLLVAPGVWVLLLLAIGAGLLLNRTVFGTHTYAIGSNEDNARLCGVQVPRMKVAIYTLCGTLAGLGGVMHFSRLTVGDPTAATGLELNIIAAVVIGGGSLAGGQGTIVGSMIGAFIMAFLQNGCTLVGVPTYAQEILIGIIIVGAVAMDARHMRRLTSS